MRLIFSLCIGAGILCLIPSASAEDKPLILTGKVQMEDGSPPPKPVGIQRTCSDSQGTPGPITDKKGNWLWRLQVDPMRTRVCSLQATSPGYGSTSIDISDLNGFTSTTKELPPLILFPVAPNPMTINMDEKGVPGKSMDSWKAAMKAVTTGNYVEAEKQLQTVVNASPKFARGWHTLAIMYSSNQKGPEAKDAWGRAIESDPKMLQPYVALARLCVKLKDWQCTEMTADALFKVDKKNSFPEIYIHQAVARYGAKDLDGAQSAAENAVKLDLVHKRAKYVLGRILEAKGDIAGAKEYMTKYVESDPKAADIELVKKHLELIGTPAAAGAEPEMDVL